MKMVEAKKREKRGGRRGLGKVGESIKKRSRGQTNKQKKTDDCSWTYDFFFFLTKKRRRNKEEEIKREDFALFLSRSFFFSLLLLR